MAGNKFLKGLAAQFGVQVDEGEQNQGVGDSLTPEQRRQAEIELQATLRGKIVPQKRVPPTDTPLGDIGPEVSNTGPVDGSGNVDFTALYAQAGVAPAKFTAEQALDIIKDCEPTEAARKQTIKVISTFGKSVGATPDEIIVDAVDKQDAIRAFLGARDDELAAFGSKAEDQITALLARVEQIKQMQQSATRQHDTVRSVCQEEAARLETVRDFFRQEVPV